MVAGSRQRNPQAPSQTSHDTERLVVRIAVENSVGATLAPLAVTLSVLGLSDAGSQFSPLEFLQLGHECLGGDDCKTSSNDSRKADGRDRR